MNVLEKEIEDLIKDCIDCEMGHELAKKGFGIVNEYDTFFRQVPLGNYGRLDLLAVGYNHFNRSIKIGVFEFKKGEINLSTFSQAVRYCKGLEKILENNFPNIWIDFEIILVGTTASDEIIYFPDFVSNLKLYTLKIDLMEGIIFHKKSNYQLSNEGSLFLNEEIVKKVKRGIRKNIRNYFEKLIELPF